jgi:Tol biopolymer transport system component
MSKSKSRIPTYCFPYFQLVTPLPETREQQVQHWWVNGQHYRRVAHITAESLTHARALLSEEAWYRRPEVTLLAKVPLRLWVNGDVLLYVNSLGFWHPWMIRDDIMVDLGMARPDEPVERQSHQKAILAVAWSPDGERYAACGKQGLVRVYTPGSQRDPDYNTHAAYAQALAWSPDGKRMATGDCRDATHIWDVATDLSGANADIGRILICREYRQSDFFQGVYAVAWSPDSHFAASGNHFGEVRMWDVATGACKFINRDHGGSAVRAVAWSPDGKFLASAGDGGIVLIWDIPLDKHHTTIIPEMGPIRALAWSPDSKSLLIGGGESHLLSLYQGFPYQPALGIQRRDIPLSIYSDVTGVLSVAFAPSGTHAVAGCADGAVQVVDLASSAHVYSYFGHKGAVNVVAWSPDGKYILSGGEDTHVFLWNAASVSEQSSTLLESIEEA